MTSCLLCEADMKLLLSDIEDWEYGVQWDSTLVICPRCGLVSQDPEVRAEDISALYPDSYLAHSSASTSKSIYGKLKEFLARRTARKIASNVPHAGTMLEIGCGNGHLLKRIAQVRPDIKFMGVDIENANISGIENFRFFHGQFEAVNIEDSSCDFIYCSNLIEHVPNPALFLDKIYRTLKNDGMILGVTPNHLSFDRYLFGKYWAGYHYPRHTFLFNHHNLRTLLERAKLDDITVTGAYSFWYLSFANRFQDLPGTRKRGVLFALVTALFLPIDLLINLFRCHGSMSFSGKARKR